MTAPAKVIVFDQPEEPPESDPGALSGVVKRAPPQPVEDHQEACDESALAEALTLAARAGRWDVVAYLAELRRSKPGP